MPPFYLVLMDDLDFQYAVAKPGAANPDDAMIVIFKNMEFRNNVKSEQEGRPIWESKECVLVHRPGDKHPLWDGPVTPALKAQFQSRYDAWKAKKPVTLEGTPLKEWPSVERTMIAVLNELKIFTVEQLASVSDSSLTNLGPGAVSLRQKAQTFLDFSKNATQYAAVTAELEKAKIENQKLTEMVAKLSTEMEAIRGLMIPKEKKKRKPAKVKEELELVLNGEHN